MSSLFFRMFAQVFELVPRGGVQVVGGGGRPLTNWYSARQGHAQGAIWREREGGRKGVNERERAREGERERERAREGK